VIDEACRVYFLSATFKGNAHDKSLADLAGDTWPAGSCLDQDLGFQGFVLAGVTHSSDEPMYSLDAVKEPNPDHEKR
jgi:hypothetical protein